MLALSGLSGLSYSTSGISQDVDLELVEQIIDRAPRSATTFPLVYKAYGEVLEENDLSPSSDTVYYQFLLKLGVIRASTWGERWDLWKATNTIKSRSLTSPRKVKTRDTDSRSAEIKARLPFLASASSDLDEGFEGDGESVVAEMIRPSPRKEIYRDKSRTLVGHSPTPSGDYDQSTLDLPFRTSTPVRGQNHSTPPLPPYSESDISASPAMSIEYDGPSTPQPTTYDDQLELDEDVVHELERQADQFYETGLRGRCWDVWAAASDWIQKTTLQIDTVRSNILLRQTLARWRAVHRHQLDLPNTADTHREHHLKSKALSTWLLRLRQADLQLRAQEWENGQNERHTGRCWAHWRNRLIKKRTERWTRDMATREKSFSGHRDQALALSTINHWRDRTVDSVNERLADNHFDHRAKRHTTQKWRYRAQQQQELDLRERSLAERQRLDLLASCLFAWRQEARLGAAERLFAVAIANRHLRRAWVEWSAKTFQRQTALELFERHSIGRAFARWKHARQRIQTLERTADAVREKTDTIVLRQAFDSWVCSERGQLLRSVYNGRIVKASFARWRARHHRQLELHIVAEDYSRQLERRHLSSFMSRWRDVHGRWQNQALQADLIHEGRSLIKAFRIWSTASQRIATREAIADNAYRFFTERTVLQCWQAAYEQRKRQAWIAKREARQMRGIFDTWMSATVQSVQDRRAVALFEQKTDTRLLRDSLGQWTRRVVDIKSLELDVAEKRDAVVLRHAMSRWTASSKRVKELKALMHSFRDVKVEDSLRAVLQSWHHSTQSSRQRRMALAHAEDERSRKLLTTSFDHWRSRYRENCLQPIEEEVALRREDAIIFGAWDSWKAKSKNLHAVSMNGRRVKTMAWARWQRALSLTIQAKEAKAAADRHLLQEVFATWKDAAKHKVSLKTSRIRGRIRPSSSTSQARRTSIPQARRITSSYQVDRDHTSVRADRGQDTELAGPESVASEPAYSRLRSELAGRRRGASEEPEDVSGNEVLRALRGALGRPS